MHVIYRLQLSAVYVIYGLRNEAPGVKTMWHDMTAENADKFYISDWAGNRMYGGDFAAQLWDSFEDARDAVQVHVNNMLDAGEITAEEAEEEAGDYYAYSVADYLESAMFTYDKMFGRNR